MDKKSQIDLKIDKTAFSISSLSDPPDDRSYWLKRTPNERIRQIEILRRINYGHLATSRLQRILEVAER